MLKFFGAVNLLVLHRTLRNSSMLNIYYELKLNSRSPVMELHLGVSDGLFEFVCKE